ncbi:MAG: Undecaprenyl-phosphate galactosephosphotransferase [Acidobacteria bacterium]|nr:Undecaprenyl-phosphate galactosephosphotransferase [Acidobacteriota bacterium]
MLREPARLIAYRRLLLDELLTAASFLAAHQLRSQLGPVLLPSVFPGGLYPLSTYLPLLPFVLVVWGLLLTALRAAAPGEAFSLPREIGRVLRAVALGVLVVAAAGYLLRLEFVSRPFLLLFGVTSALAMTLARVLERRTRWGRRLLRAPERVVVVVGCDDDAVALAGRIAAHRDWGFTVRGLVDADGCGRTEVGGLPVLATVDRLPDLLASEVIDEVVLAVAPRQLGDQEDLLLRCQELGVRVRVALRPFAHLAPRLEVERFDGVPLLTFATMPTATLALFVKRVFDVVVAALGLVVLLPLWLLIAVAIRLSSAGPVLFRQVRCGLRGRRFVLLKFRTMVEDADQRRAEVDHLNVMDGPVFKAPDDPRVTGLGRWLRRSSLDELPQLVNILRGDMSLVGPRPPLPDEVVRYQPWQRRRLAMKPGLTCLWQVSGRSALDFATWMELDLAYIDSWSLWLDLKILARTVPAVLRGHGAE